eukprot:CAMPEP_0175173590 /NCGR_PEP_ID=MMETSP0087-20121206/32140_1 /TAXON_ID=136419 /ORGANISM="Unknown Unknown, Strain D1" /LENGTH=641 /DNA_ID=CAMNT_0016464923 /DNA_START=177 /DNA_END=2102 /DNA_ORIENTATION=-
MLAMFWGQPSELVLFFASTVLLLAGVVDKQDVLKGFGDNSVVTIGLLLILARGVEETGTLERVLKYMLGKPSSTLSAQLRLFLPVAMLSAFLSNTACVAMLIPIVRSWSEEIGVSLSHLLLPMSYISMVGGCLSLIGSSNNLVARNAAMQTHKDVSVGLFDVAVVGAPTLIAALLYMVAFSRILLPAQVGGRTGHPEEGVGKSLRYTVPFVVNKLRSNQVAGKNASQAGFDKEGITLVHVFSNGNTADDVVGLHDRCFQEDDLLVFEVTPGRVCELRRIPGLVPGSVMLQELNDLDRVFRKRRHRRLFEVIIDPRSNLVGQTVEQSGFMENFNAVILARRVGLPVSVDREEDLYSINMSMSLDEPFNLPQSAGQWTTVWNDVVLGPADALLLEANKGFSSSNPDFALVSLLSGSKPHRQQSKKDQMRSLLTWVMLVALVGVSAYNEEYLFHCCAVSVIIQIYTQCLTLSEAWASIKGSVLLTIVASFSLGAAMQKSGLAEDVASIIDGVNVGGNFGILAAGYLLTACLSNLVSNTAVVVFMFPVFDEAAKKINMRIEPFIFLLMMASSAAFATPISYQTNLMVYAPGGYKFGHYIKFGGPLQLICWVVSTVVIYFRWGNMSEPQSFPTRAPTGPPSLAPTT